jgi:hypothetical protein
LDLIERVKFLAYRVVIYACPTVRSFRNSLLLRELQTVRPGMPQKTAAVSLQSALAGSIKIGLLRRISNILAVYFINGISLASEGNVFRRRRRCCARFSRVYPHE